MILHIFFVLFFLFVYLWININGLTCCNSQETSHVCRAGQTEREQATAHNIPDDLLPRVTSIKDVSSRRHTAESLLFGKTN